MFVNLIRIFRTTKSQINLRFRHYYIFKMDKAYFRHINGSEQFHVTFFYENANRQFNFSRQLTETIPTFLSRVSTNVEKVVNKKKNKKNKNTENSTANETANASIILNNNKVTNDQAICQDVFKKDNQIVLTIFDKQYNVIINSPWIESLALPTCILATFPVYPSKFETYFTDIDKSEFKWFKSSDDKNTWVEVGNGFIYIPGNSDVNCYLKLIWVPKNNESEGPAVEKIAEAKVAASPGYCPFESRHAFTKTPLPKNEFRVVSYNLLADLYCDSDYTRAVLYPYCPPYALAIDYRKQLILKELLGYNADIICLQEVDRKLYKYEFIPVFNKLNYEVNFKQKGEQIAEGLACAFNKNKFNLLNSYDIVISEELEKNKMFSDIFMKICANEKLKLRLLERPNVLQVLLLQCKDNEKLILVANTHLYFHPDADHIRLMQGGLAILYLQETIQEVKKDYPDNSISVVFCGDFNSVPECGIYKLYTTGEVSQDCIDFQSNKDEAVCNVSFKQTFKLASGCGTPKYTNFTSGFQDCLDYIYYEKEALSVTQVVPMPSDEELTANTALPSVVFPSDHISLICDFKWL